MRNLHTLYIFALVDIFQYSDYRNYLKDVYETRVKKNSRYSLRSYARDLNITPQSLSLVLKNKRKISLNTGARIAEKLNLSSKASGYLMDLISSSDSKTNQTKVIFQRRINSESKKNITAYEQLDSEKFKVISGWQHYAILELMDTIDYCPEISFIAKRLGLSNKEVIIALDRLKKIGLIEDTVVFKKTGKSLTTTRNVPSQEIRKFNRDILSKAISSLEEQTVKERDISSMTMAIDPDLIPEAQEMIRDFRRSLCAFLESGSKREVYNLNINLFKLSKEKK